MYLKIRDLSLLFVIIVLSCKPEKKISGENKKSSDTIHLNATVIKSYVVDVKKISIDTATVLNAFKKNIKTDQFIKELYMDSYATVFDSERPILIGDLNDDHQDDAIMPFSIEGRDGGNNWDTHYAIFINNNGQLEYKYSFARGGDLAEKQIDFKNIQNGVIHGIEVPGFHYPDGDSTSVEYIYRNSELSKVLGPSEVK